MQLHRSFYSSSRLNLASVFRRQCHRQLHSFTRRLFKLPSPPPHPSAHHHDLPSFLAYADRTSLSPNATTYIGLLYEYTVQQTLRASAFTLHRVGGRDDAGIDLVGTWHLPHREHPLRVIVQCKSLKTKLGPNLVRELEGTFNQSPVGWRTGDEIGILVGPREATKGVRDALTRSSYPLIWMMIERDGTLRQVLWNGKAEQLGLVNLGVEVRYSADEDADSSNGIVLTWDGEEIPNMEQVERQVNAVEDRWLRSWGDASHGEQRNKSELLDAVQKLFPEEKPLLWGTGACSTLTDADRVKVIQFLDSKTSAQAEAASGIKHTST
ncbi:hypothetical protein BDV26DRAFT_130587 [Aspergillus bertholletiae]|uniref:Restriction endonuclease type IV Mrr domain-containing protein n=1 Tax=Aspergillus bertholletiae TaxID=1226010 RepID=A0A5N7ANV0_9EURO|nr:hypothetical protein BDV26DRAFT_130587 [Aspergillus bertholletiae]